MSLEFVSMGPISKIPALVQIKWLGAVWTNNGWLTDAFMCDWAPISQTGSSFAVTEHGTILFRNRIFKFIATCVMANRLIYALFQYPSQKSNLYCEPYTQSERLRELYYRYHYYHCYCQCYHLLSLVLLLITLIIINIIIIIIIITIKDSYLRIDQFFITDHKKFIKCIIYISV